MMLAAAFLGLLYMAGPCYGDDDRIVGGVNANTNIPFYTLVQTGGFGIFFPQGKQWCGGILMGERTVLTAGTCMTSKDLFGKTKWDTRGGRVVLDRYNMSMQVKTYTVWKMHEWFQEETFLNDIALICLDSKAATKVKDLEGATIASTPVVLGEELQFAGMGNTETGSTSVLKVGKMNVLADSACSILTAFNKTHNFCAAGDRSNLPVACWGGDEGGAIWRKGTNEIVGMASFGAADCAKSGHAFTRLLKYKDYIEERVRRCEAQGNFNGGEQLTISYALGLLSLLLIKAN